MDVSKIITSRAHRYCSAAPRAKTLLFLEIARTILFKMSGGSAYLRSRGRELYSQNRKCQDLSAWLYIYINIYSLSGATLATYPRSDGEATLAKRWSKHKMFRNCDFIGVIRVSLQTNQIPWIRWKKFLEPQWNLLQQIGDHFLTFVWWGGNDPKTSHKLGMCMYIGICLC